MLKLINCYFAGSDIIDDKLSDRPVHAFNLHLFKWIVMPMYAVNAISMRSEFKVDKASYNKLQRVVSCITLTVLRNIIETVESFSPACVPMCTE